MLFSSVSPRQRMVTLRVWVEKNIAACPAELPAPTMCTSSPWVLGASLGAAPYEILFPASRSNPSTDKRRHATPSTRFFCDELLRIYGAEDPSVAEGASFAVEHWAAAGFWKELIAGLKAFKDRECPLLPLGFWIWHDKIEDQHAAHTADELADAFFRPDFDEERFLAGAAEMLDGVKAFWDGLQHDRAERKAA